MYYLTENNEIISDEQIKKIKGACLVSTTLYDDEFQVIGRIKKQSDNVFDLIDRENDLVKIELLDGYFNIIGVKTLNGNWKENDRISAIYKPNEKGDYIKVWEVKDNEKD